jgi:hypothetical protein
MGPPNSLPEGHMVEGTYQAMPKGLRGLDARHFGNGRRCPGMRRLARRTPSAREAFVAPGPRHDQAGPTSYGCGSGTFLSWCRIRWIMTTWAETKPSIPQALPRHHENSAGGRWRSSAVRLNGSYGRTTDASTTSPYVRLPPKVARAAILPGQRKHSAQGTSQTRLGQHLLNAAREIRLA